MQDGDEHTMNDGRVIPFWLAIPILAGAIVLAVVLTVCDVVWAWVKGWGKK